MDERANVLQTREIWRIRGLCRFLTSERSTGEYALPIDVHFLRVWRLVSLSRQAAPAANTLYRLAFSRYSLGTRLLVIQHCAHNRYESRVDRVRPGSVSMGNTQSICVEMISM